MQLTGQTILIVDDSSDDRFFMGRALKCVASGLSVQYAVSGDDAVAYLEGSGAYANRLLFPYPSFVITDLNMPDGDGFSLLRHLQAGAHPFLRVMMLSSSDDPHHPGQAYGLGASAYSIKPQDPRELVPILSQFLDPLPPLPHERCDGLIPMRVA